MNEYQESLPLKQFTEKAYLDYAMYVILDRALPHIGDGLKPVQRRITYAMSELGLKATAKHKKSARTVGDVLGKFHPHGDSACYEAMVLMAQSFTYRYPIVDGQGNWGSQDDPKSFAAMRYTESRLAPYAEVLLSELGQGTVDWQNNFDGTLTEPMVLPARLPNILLNGTTGIAVGMATDIPPHNLNEVAEACIHLLSNPKATTQELLEFVKGPDFPTQAEIITPKSDILEAYEKGHGSVRMRAAYEVHNGEIIIDALPYQVSGAKVLEQIAAQMQTKKLPMVADLRDESDHEHPIRLVVVPKSNRVDCQALMSHLFASTDLERSYRINLNMIGLDGKPQVKSLQMLLNEWLVFRKNTVKRRLQYRLDKVLKRLHLLEGLLIAFLNIDEVIEIIRNEDKPKPVLMNRFNLSDEQAEAILDLKLRHLAKLEEVKITAEQQELEQERQSLEAILNSATKLTNLVRKELKEDAKLYGDKRRSPLKEREVAKAFSELDVLPTEAVTIVLSTKGWIRCAKGHDIDLSNLSYKSGDSFKSKACGRSNQPLIIFDATGRAYNVMPHTLPSARGQGEPLTGKLNPPTATQFTWMILDKPNQTYLLATDNGYGFITNTEHLLTKNRQGKSVVNLAEGCQLLPPEKVEDINESQIAIATSQGRLLIFPVAEVPQLPRGKGNKLIGIPKIDWQARHELIVSIKIMSSSANLIVQAGKRELLLKGNDIEQYFGARGRRGQKLPRGFQRVTQLIVQNPEAPTNQTEENE